MAVLAARVCLANVLIFILSLVVTPVAFLVLIFFLLPVYIYRWLVSKIVPLCYPDMGKMVNAQSALMTSEWERISTQPLMNSCSSAKLEGELTLEEVTREICDKVVFLKNAQGVLLYPELQQYHVKRLGYIFYHWDKHFDIKNHVRYFEDESPANQDKFEDIRLRLVSSPFPKNTSPWEVVILKNFRRDNDISSIHKSVLFFRCHHSLSDGFATQKLIFQGFFHEKGNHKSNLQYMLKSPPSEERHRVNKNPCRDFARGFCNIFTVPFRVVKYARENKDELSTWHLPIDKLSRKRIIVEAERIPMDVIKNIKNKFKVRYISVLMSAIGGGIRNYSLKNQIEFPPDMHMYVPLRLEGHPSKLRNHLTGCPFKIPLTEDPLERLKMTNENIEKSFRSIGPSLLAFVSIAVGSLPVNWIKNLESTACTLVMSAVPGPTFELWHNNKHRILELGFSGGVGRTNISIGCSTLSYNNGASFSIGCDQALLKTKGELQELLDTIFKEIDVLQKIAEP